jgi:hypothetical protein
MMFGGLWRADVAVAEGAIAFSDVAELGQQALGILVQGLAKCAAAQRSTTTDPYADAIALWLGLHGLADQRAVSTACPWPADISERLVTPLAHISQA